MQTYSEITSDRFLNYIKDYVMGIGPWKDTVVPPKDNYLERATDLVARAHALGLQVFIYTFSFHSKADFFAVGCYLFLEDSKSRVLSELNTGASLYFPKWEFIFALWLSPRPICRVWLLDKQDWSWWALHRFHGEPPQISRMDLSSLQDVRMMQQRVASLGGSSCFYLKGVAILLGFGLDGFGIAIKLSVLMSLFFVTLNKCYSENGTWFGIYHFFCCPSI